MKKLSNKILIATLLVLVTVFALSRVFRSPGLESNLRKELVMLDTANVTEVRILPSSHREEEIKLVRQGNRWKVSKGKQASETDKALVDNMLTLLAYTKAERIASRKKEKWEEFNVGEKGTHIMVYDHAEKAADFHIGKTGFIQSQTGGYGGSYTYLRLSDENDVYAVEGFLASNLDRSFNDWRNKALLRLKKDDIARITFQYPLDSGFVAEKKDSVWYVANEKADVAPMENFLNQLSFKNLNEFAEDFVPAAPPDVIVGIDGKAGALDRVEAWKKDQGWTLTSTLQKGVYFSATSALAGSILIGKKKLLPGVKK